MISRRTFAGLLSSALAGISLGFLPRSRKRFLAQTKVPEGYFCCLVVGWPMTKSETRAYLLSRYEFWKRQVIEGDPDVKLNVAPWGHKWKTHGGKEIPVV